MKITRHTGINRFGRHERPVTIEDDDGRLFDTVLFFDTAPSVPNIEAAAVEYVNRVKAAESVTDPGQLVPVSEIEAVLKMKGITEPWETWKGTPSAAILTEPKNKEPE